MADVWRVRMNSGGWVDHAAARAFAFANGIFGTGWGLNDGPPEHQLADGCTDLAAYLQRAARVHHPGRYSIYATRIAVDMQIGDFFWTYETSTGEYWCGEVTGPFAYRCGGDYDLHDLHLVRPCRWAVAGTAEAVPGVVRRALAGGFGVITRMREGAETATEAARRVLDSAAAVISADFFASVSPEDLEDVVALLLQNQGWMVLPSTSKQAMAHYEYILVEATSGRRAGVQVKSGGAGLAIDQIAIGLDQYFVFLSRGTLATDHPAVTAITPDELLTFAKENHRLLPRRLQVRWAPGRG